MYLLSDMKNVSEGEKCSVKHCLSVKKKKKDVFNRNCNFDCNRWVAINVSDSKRKNKVAFEYCIRCYSVNNSFNWFDICRQNAWVSPRLQKQVPVQNCLNFQLIFSPCTFWVTLTKRNVVRQNGGECPHKKKKSIVVNKSCCLVFCMK